MFIIYKTYRKYNVLTKFIYIFFDDVLRVHTHTRAHTVIYTARLTCGIIWDSSVQGVTAMSFSIHK